MACVRSLPRPERGCLTWLRRSGRVWRCTQQIERLHAVMHDKCYRWPPKSRFLKHPFGAVFRLSESASPMSILDGRSSRDSNGVSRYNDVPASAMGHTPKGVWMVVAYPVPSYGDNQKPCAACLRISRPGVAGLVPVYPHIQLWLHIPRTLRATSQKGCGWWPCTPPPPTRTTPIGMPQGSAPICWYPIT